MLQEVKWLSCEGMSSPQDFLFAVLQCLTLSSFQSGAARSDHGAGRSLPCLTSRSRDLCLAPLATARV